jgi:hypothetical protein
VPFGAGPAELERSGWSRWAAAGRAWLQPRIIPVGAVLVGMALVLASLTYLAGSHVAKKPDCKYLRPHVQYDVDEHGRRIGPAATRFCAADLEVDTASRFRSRH